MNFREGFLNMENNKSLNEEYFRNEFLKLGSKSFALALRIAKRAGLSHRWYQHYMSLSNLEKMVKGGMLWLTRLDNKELNDWHEGVKYGSRLRCRRMYIGCFSYGGGESAAMWRMYCKPCADSVRVLISQKGMQIWAKKLSKKNSIDARWIIKDQIRGVCRSIKKAGIGDVLYAAVKKDNSDPERSNSLFWNGAQRYVEDLHEWVKSPNIEGFLKDCEWCYENETRLFAQVTRAKEGADRLAIRVPEDVFNHMSIVLSPWLADEYVKEKAEQIKLLFENNGYKKPHVRKSFLTGALGSWQ